MALLTRSFALCEAARFTLDPEYEVTKLAYWLMTGFLFPETPCTPNLPYCSLPIKNGLIFKQTSPLSTVSHCLFSHSYSHTDEAAKAERYLCDINTHATRVHYLPRPHTSIRGTPKKISLGALLASFP